MPRCRFVLALPVVLVSCAPPTEHVPELPLEAVANAATQTQWRERQILDNPNPSTDDSFGCAVAINDRFIVVGDYNEDEGGVNAAGAVYVFDAADGVLLTRIANPAPVANDFFGSKIALFGDRLLITAEYADVLPGDDAGRVWLFDAPSGSLLFEVGAGESSADRYGIALALDDDIIVVGSYADVPGFPFGGRVYVYSLDGTILYTLDSPAGANQGLFGAAVGISGTRIFIGAPEEAAGADTQVGRVYVYHRTSGQLLGTIENPDAIRRADQFGKPLRVSGSLVAIAAEDDGIVVPQHNRGTVYLVNSDTGDFLQEFSNPESGGNFGEAIAFDGSSLVIGSWENSAGPGKVRIYDVETGALKLQLNGVGTSAALGFSADLSGDIVVVGAPGEQVGAVPGAGRVRVLERNTSPTALSMNALVSEDGSTPTTLQAADEQNDPLTFVVTSGPFSGVLSGTAPSLTYTPNPDFSGTDFFTFKASEQPSGVLESDPATVMIQVNSLDDLPVASSDSFTISEDTAAMLNTLENDNGIGDGPITVSILSGPTSGTAFETSGNQIRYQPSANFNGADSFTYRVTDVDGDNSTTTVNVTVSSVDDLPVANGDGVTTPENQPTTVQVLANDTGLGDEPVAVSIFSPPTSGQASVSGALVSYQPNAGFSGNDSIIYRVTDGDGDVSNATVSITVQAIDANPTAVADAATIPEGQAVSISVLANDAGLGDAPLTVAITSPAANGQTIVGGHIVTYQPNNAFSGSDAFTYRVTDADGDESTATVSITVQSVDTAPVAVADAVTFPEDQAVTVAVLQNDSGLGDAPLTLQILSGPANGQAAFSGQLLVYQPSPNFSGTDGVTYRITDGDGDLASATVQFTVQVVDDLPAAVADLATTLEDQAVSIPVLENDAGLQEGPFAVSIVSAPSSGQISISSEVVTFHPATNASGTVPFTYRVTDADGDFSDGAVSVTVQGVNDAPVATGDSVSTPEDDSVDVDILANDVDAEGSALTAIIITQPANGSATINAGVATYVPDPSFSGPDSFVYRASDGGLTATASVSVSVLAVNDGPPAAPGAGSPTTGSVVSANPLVLMVPNTVDPDGDPLTYEFEIDRDPSFGSASLAMSGPIAPGVTSTSWTGPNLEEDVQYYWRVRARDPQLAGDWYQSSLFFSATDDPPGTPAIIGPSGGVLVKDLPTLEIETTADPEGGSVTYSFELRVGAQDGEIVEAAQDVLSDGDRVSFTVSAALDKGSVYYWRAIATDAGGNDSAASPFASFQVYKIPKDGTGSCSVTPDGSRSAVSLSVLVLVSIFAVRRRKSWWVEQPPLASRHAAR